MIRIGVAGNAKIGMLALRTLDPAKFKIVTMEPKTLCTIPKIATWRRMTYFRKMLDSVDVAMFVYPERWTAWAVKQTKEQGKKTMLFWIGTDVYHLVNSDLPFKEVGEVDLHLCLGERLRGELAGMGVDAQCLYVPSDLPEEYAPMPDRHAVLLSIPDARAEFYGYDTYVRLFQDFPGTTFIVTRSETPSLYAFPNVDFRGKLSREGMDRAYADSTISIRIPEHDATSLVVLEALMKGKQVICNYPFPFTHEAHTYEGLRDALAGILAAPPQLNVEGHDYVAAECGVERCGEMLAAYIEGLL